MMSMDSLKERYAGAQTFLTEGCLFLSLCSIAEQKSETRVDILETLRYCRKMGYINSKNEMTEESQCMLLRDLTGDSWERQEFTQLPAVIPDAMYTVEKWGNPRTGYTHFRRRFMDTLTDSITVKEGSLLCYYGYVHD